MAGLLFVLVAGSSVIVLVGVLVIRGLEVDPLLRALRTWIAGHNGLVNALTLVVLKVLQASKAIQTL